MIHIMTAQIERVRSAAASLTAMAAMIGPGAAHADGQARFPEAKPPPGSASTATNVNAARLSVACRF
jgi:hypothetical protein